jgi:hypothetical protein
MAVVGDGAQWDMWVTGWNLIKDCLSHGNGLATVLDKTALFYLFHMCLLVLPLSAMNQGSIKPLPDANVQS